MPAVNAPLKVMVPVVLLKVTVVAPTAPPKVVPPELVIVTVPISVPIAPSTVTVPEELIVIFDLPNKDPLVPPAVPEIDLTDIKPGPPLPRVNVTLSARVIAPRITSTFGLL